MPRIILLTDLTEEYAKNLLKGIVRYSKEHEPWVLCKMPPSYHVKHGVEGVLKWAKKWKADGIIARFYNTDPVDIFRKNGIAAIAQDFKSRFTEIPNITGAHHLAGKMGADYFIQKGFKNFAFYGYKDFVWSSERCDGFLDGIRKHQLSTNFYEYQNDNLKELWYYESAPLIAWLQQLPKPVALMACDDNQGHHIAEVCKQCGIKVPEEIAILGVDNDEAVCSLSDPPLSSLNQAVEKGGYETAQLMSRMIQNPHDHYEDVVVYPTHIITRQSTDIYATNDKYISTILQYIHQNVNKKLTIDQFILLVPLSRRLLENRFKQEIGIPIYTYIMNLRIEKFAHRLLETDSSIMEITDEISYSDYKNIARQFKKIKGYTPSEYKIKNSIR
ncbi:XylR family transcriptional regulator [Bacteroidia bacterium]|nr:XylR family transcriptional regulator [Bacteroidia bacterium]GHT64737.1 XylR family transcriptional regulator [Bacteroidia bacterium]